VLHVPSTLALRVRTVLGFLLHPRLVLFPLSLLLLLLLVWLAETKP